MDKGTVLAVHPRKPLIVVAVDGDSCAVFELGASYDIEVGHRLRGNLESDLCYALENLTTGEMLDVAPAGRHPTAEQAKRAHGF